MHSLRPLLLTCLVLSTLTNAATAGKFMVRMQTEKREVVGDPVFWNQDEFYLLSRDGYLFNFDMVKARRLSESTRRSGRLRKARRRPRSLVSLAPSST